MKVAVYKTVREVIDVSDKFTTLDDLYEEYHQTTDKTKEREIGSKINKLERELSIEVENKTDGYVVAIWSVDENLEDEEMIFED